MRTKIGSLVLSLCFLFGAGTVKAQEAGQMDGFTGGISAGVSTTSVKISRVDNALVDVIDGDNIYGVEFGVYGKMKAGPFYIKPMALASYSRGQVDITNLDGTHEETDFSFGRITIPLLVGLNVIGPLNLEAGPAFNWMYYSNFHNDAVTVAVRDIGMGYRLGLNAEFDRVLLGAHWQGMVNTHAGNAATIRSPNELIFSIGLRLGADVVPDRIDDDGDGDGDVDVDVEVD